MPNYISSTGTLAKAGNIMYFYPDKDKGVMPYCFDVSYLDPARDLPLAEPVHASLAVAPFTQSYGQDPVGTYVCFMRLNYMNFIVDRGEYLGLSATYTGGLGWEIVSPPLDAIPEVTRVETTPGGQGRVIVFGRGCTEGKIFVRWGTVAVSEANVCPRRFVTAFTEPRLLHRPRNARVVYYHNNREHNLATLLRPLDYPRWINSSILRLPGVSQ